MLNSLLRGACRIPVAHFSTSQCIRGKVRDFQKFKELQKPFLVDDGVPMYIKKGSGDRVVFGLICLYSAIVMGFCAEFCYTVVYPPKSG